MRPVLAVALALAAVMLVASPSFAEDGKVSADTLVVLGLGGLQEMSAAEGMQVRGRLTGTGTVIGTSLISYQFVNPSTQAFINGGSVNSIAGTATFSGLGQSITGFHSVNFTPPLIFTVAVPFTFIGSIAGGIGGTGSISLP